MSNTDKRERFIILTFCALMTIALIVDGCKVVSAVEFRRAEPTLGDVHAASCRVRVSNARGTGIFNGYNAAENVAYISTNDHVTTTAAACKLDFWTNSKMETIDGRVVYSLRNDTQARDFAIIAVDATQLKKIDPPYIPMKSLELQSLQGRRFLSSGCPDGRFDQGFRGTIERTDGGMAIFSPPPVPGQSGSGICVLDGGKIYDVAKLTYLLGTKGADESKGGALPLINLTTAASSFDFGAARIEWEKTPVAYLFENDEEATQGPTLYSLGKDNGVKMQAPGEGEKTIAVYITDPASYDMSPAPVASRAAPRGLLNDLFKDGEDDEGDDEEETPTEPPSKRRPRIINPDSDGGGLGAGIVEKIGDKVGDSVQTAAGKIWTKYKKALFWLFVISACLGAILARFILGAVKYWAKAARAFLDAFKAALNEKGKE